MKKAEFALAVAMVDTAPGGAGIFPAPYGKVDINHMIGCGLPGFESVPVTLKQVAAFIAWEARQLNGEWNAEALTECWHIARYRFFLVGEDVLITQGMKSV